MIDVALRERTLPRMFARALERGPDRPFLVTAEATVTYAEAERLVAGLAGHLAAVRGVGAGTRVALMLSSSPQYVWLLLALARLGAVAVTLNAEAKGRLLAYYLGDSACALGIVDGEHAATFADAAATAGMPAATVALDGPGWCERTAGEHAPPAAAHVPAFADPFAVLYTSGTTGMPKGVPVSHAHAVSCGAIFAERQGLGPDDRLYTCLPFFHINATAYSLCGALAAGAALAVGPRFSARSFWADAAATGATQVNAMGSMLRILELQEPSPAERAHGVRSVFVAPLPTDAAALGERFAVAFSTTYAQTEWLPSAMTAPGEGYGRAGVTGPLLDVGELRVVDGDDMPVPDGTIGEITLRAREPGVTFPGYLGRAGESLEAFRNLRFHTGDLGEIRDDWLYFHGRVNDVIRRRGENISPTVLEELLGAHAAVAEVAAVGVPSELMEEEVFAFVVARAGSALTLAELARFARDALPRSMVPRYLHLVDDLPRTATNKAARQALREQAAALVAGGLAPAETDPPRPGGPRP